MNFFSCLLLLLLCSILHQSLAPGTGAIAIKQTMNTYFSHGEFAVISRFSP
jgi:hypothetical protein